LPSPDFVPGSTLPVKHRRYLRNYIVDKRLQLRYIAVVSLLSAAISALLGWLIWSQRAQASQTVRKILVGAGDFIGPNQQAEILQHLAGSDSTVLLRMALVCGALILVLSGVLVVMTHKVAGPLYVIGGYFDKLAAGRLPLVHNLRRGDEFKVFHKKFRDMCNALRVEAEKDAELYGLFLAACAEARVDETGAMGHSLEELRRLKQEKEQSLTG
jgi:hypothetical protein